MDPTTQADIAALCPEASLIVQEDLSLGMQGALLSALPSLGSEDVLVVGGNDLIASSAYEQTIRDGKADGRDGAVLAWKTDRYFPGGYLRMADDRIAGIEEKPGSGNEPSDLVNIVCHYHRDASLLLSALQQESAERDDGYERALSRLMTSGSYAASLYQGAWQAVKYPWHLLDMLPLLLAECTPSIHPSADIHPTAVLSGAVRIEEGVKVLPYACINGPAIIEAHSIIGNNALVRSSSIGAHCVIGYGTEVKSSVLADHVWTHSTYIGDSVVGRNVAFGAGAVTGNFRLDEAEIHSQVGDMPLPTGRTKFGAVIGEGCRIGIHTSIAPGCKIGANCFVASALHVDKDIPDNCFIRLKNGMLDIRENRASAPDPTTRNQFRTGI